MMRKTHLLAVAALALALGTSRAAFAVSALDAYSISGILQSEQVKPLIKGRMVEKMTVSSDESGRTTTHNLTLTLSQPVLQGKAYVNQTCIVKIGVEDIMNYEGTDRVVQASLVSCK